MASHPTTIGVCEYCVKAVHKYKGGKFSDGRCYHFDCHNRILKQAFRPMELVELVLDIESLILAKPALASFYSANFPVCFTPEAISQLIEQLMEQPVARDQHLLARLKEMQSRAQKLCLAQN